MKHNVYRVVSGLMIFDVERPLAKLQTAPVLYVYVQIIVSAVHVMKGKVVFYPYFGCLVQEMYSLGESGPSG